MLDRLFVLRYHDSRLYLPQVLPVAAGLDPVRGPGACYLIRADSPHDAFGHQRQLLAGSSDHTATGHCGCPVETLGEGSLQEVLDRAAAGGAIVAPAHVPDTRVAVSRMPRCNVIHPGAGWEVPPDDPSRRERTA